MTKLKMTSTLHAISRKILVVFTMILILVLPQLNNPEYVLPTITTKFIYFLYSSAILQGIYCLTIVCTKKNFYFSKLDIALVTLLFYITLNRYFIQSHFGFSIRYMELLGLSFLYMVLRHIGLKNYPWLLLAIVVSGIIQVIYGNLQLLGYYTSNHSGFKITGSFFNPGPYAGFLASVWTVALGMYLFKDTITTSILSQTNNKAVFFNELIKSVFEYIPLLGFISIALMLPALQSRASWIATIVGSTILIELRYHFLGDLLKKSTARFQKIAIITLIIGILSAGLFGLYHYKKASSDGRAFIWKVTAEMIADTPVFGVGFDLFTSHYMNYQAQYFSKNGETPEVLLADNNNYAFNEWLQFVAENGFLGFILLLITGFVLVQTKEKPTNSIEVFMSKTGLLTIGLFACFSYPMQILPIKLVLVVLLALLSNSIADTYQFKIGEKKKKQQVYKISIVLFVCIGMYKTIAYTNDLNQGFITWNKALYNNQIRDYKEAILQFELAYPILKKDGDFLINYGKTLTMAGKPLKAIALIEQAKHYQNNTVMETILGDSYKALKQYKKSEACYQKAINMTPGKFYAPYLLTKLYDDSGQKEKAITLAKKISNKKIKIHSTAIEEIQLEIKKIILKHKKSSGN